MGTLRTLQDITNRIQAQIKNVTTIGGILKANVSDLIEDLAAYAYSGRAGSSHEIPTTIDITYDALTHRNARIFFNASVARNFTMNPGLTDLDEVVLFNVGTAKVNIITPGTFTINQKDGMIVNVLNPNGFAWLFKRKNSSEFNTFGTGLASESAPPAASSIVVRNIQVLKPGDTNFTDNAFEANLDMAANSLLFIVREYQANNANPTTALTYGGNAGTRLVGIQTPGITFPNFTEVWMFTKANAPANGLRAGAWVTAGDGELATVSQRVTKIVVDNAQQVNVPAGQIKSFAGSGVANNTLSFTGITGNYLLLNFADARDNNNPYTLSVPAEQTRLAPVLTLDFLSSITSSKAGNTSSNSMSVTGFPPARANHVAILIKQV